MLDNDHVAYAPPTPFELANALNALVEDRSPERVEAAAGSVTGTTWADAGAEFERIVRRIVEQRCAQETPA